MGIATAVIGFENVGASPGSFVSGYNSISYLAGQRVLGGNPTGISTGGYRQCSEVVLSTNTSPGDGTSLNALTATLGYVSLGVKTRILFTVKIVAMSSNGTDCASFQRYGIIKQEGNLTATLVGAVQTLGTDLGSNGGIPPATWSVQITADNSNPTGALQIRVSQSGYLTDPAVYWTIKLEFVEVARP